MELRRLRYFMTIAAEGSLGAASRALGIAQPALSRQMRLLETELGVQLFDRISTGMRLTEEGDYLRDAIGHPIQRLDFAFENVRSFATRVEANCTLGLPPEVSGFFGSVLVRSLGAAMPNLKLRLVEDDSTQLAAELMRGTIDVAILTGVTPDDRLFNAEILSEPLLLVGSPDSELRDVSEVPFRDLHRFPLILPSRPSGLPIQLEKLAARVSARLLVQHEVNSLVLTKELARTKEGFAILSPVMIRDEIAQGALIARPIVDPDLAQTVHFAVQEHWRVPSSIYLTFHRVFYDEWMRLVDDGVWPATWLFDRTELARLFS